MWRKTNAPGICHVSPVNHAFLGHIPIYSRTIAIWLIVVCQEKLPCQFCMNDKRKDQKNTSTEVSRGTQTIHKHPRKIKMSQKHPKIIQNSLTIPNFIVSSSQIAVPAPGVARPSALPTSQCPVWLAPRRCAPGRPGLIIIAREYINGEYS